MQKTDPAALPNVKIYVLCHNEERLATAKDIYAPYWWAIPILMKYQDITMENAFWKQLYEIKSDWEDCEMVGTISSKAHKKLMLPLLNSYIKQRLYIKKKHVSFITKNRIIEGTWMNTYHPHFMDIWNDMLKDLELKTTHDNHCNYWMCTPDLMKQFIPWATDVFIPTIMKHKFAMIDSTYTISPLPSYMKEKYGIDYYPLFIFVIERMNRCFFDKNT
jgi:hypothetical protein